MLAVEIRQDHPDGKLLLCERPLPSVEKGEVLIKIRHAGINRADILQRRGHYPPPPGTTDIPGLEVAGTVVGVGSREIGWPREGDQVCALLTGGGYAQFCKVEAELCMPVPDMPLEKAAVLPEAMVTVWHNVFEKGGLRPGEILLIHGGASGVGSMAIQMAKTAGALVVTTAGNQEKCNFCLRQGADLAIDYQQQDFVDVIRDFTMGRGVNVILDMVGGDYIEKNIRCLAEEGRLVQIALQQGRRISLDYLPVMSKRLTLTGSTLRNRPASSKAAMIRHMLTCFAEHLGRNIQPHIHARFAMAEANAAHAVMEASSHMGKLLLDIPD